MTSYKACVLIITLLSVLITSCQNNYNLSETKVSQSLVVSDEDDRFIKTKRLAEHDDAEAQYHLGAMFYLGEGVEKDDAQAFTWYQKAAKKGFKEAQYSLGVMYYNGEGVTQDYNTAFDWFKRSNLIFSKMHHNLNNPIRDDTKLLEWLEYMASQGNAKAQYELGVMYYYGRNVNQSYSKAQQLFEQSASQGHTESSYRLGNMYFYGENVKRSYELALYWYNQAAKQRHAESQFMLGIIYERAENKEEAMYWYAKACELGNQVSCDFYQLLNEEDN